jgi:hypothetical protein
MIRIFSISGETKRISSPVRPRRTPTAAHSAPSLAIFRIGGHIQRGGAERSHPGNEGIALASETLLLALTFVAVLGASNHSDAEATWMQTLLDWIEAHVRMFCFFKRGAGDSDFLTSDQVIGLMHNAARLPGLFWQTYWPSILPRASAR